MGKATITELHGVEPMREGEYPFYFKVGVDGVTAIVRALNREVYKIYRGKNLHCEMNVLSVAAVFFTEG